MPAVRRRLSLSLPSDLLDAASTLIANGKEDPDVPWSTLTELVTWSLREAPAEVKRRRDARDKAALEQTVGQAILAGQPFARSFRIALPFVWRTTSSYAGRHPGHLPLAMLVKQEGPPFAGPYLPLAVMDVRVLRITGFEVRGKAGPIKVVGEDPFKTRWEIPVPSRGKAIVLRLDIGGSPNLMAEDGTLRAHPILMHPNECWVDLVVHPEDGPFEVLLHVIELLIDVRRGHPMLRLSRES